MAHEISRKLRHLYIIIIMYILYNYIRTMDKKNYIRTDGDIAKLLLQIVP